MTLIVELDETPVAVSNLLIGGTGGTLSAQSLPSAADGSGSVGAILFDDPEGSLSIVGWQVCQVFEDDCVAAPTQFWGFVGERTEQRGPYKDGAARVIDTSIIDANTMLMARIVTGASANRPSETVAARMAWLLASDAVSDPAGGPPMFSDLGFVNASTSKILDAANYRGMYPAEVLNSMVSEREEIFFLYWDQTAEAVGLFFDRPTATTFTCSLSVSNVLSDTGDIDDPGTTCFAPYLDGSLTWNPEDVYSTGSMTYTGGTEYAINPATYAFFDAPSTILTRSFRVENDKVGRATTAHILLSRMLAADATERETLRFTVRLPSTKVGLIQAGMRIQCRFSHLTGFGSFTYTRIEALVKVPVDGDPKHYDVTVACSLHGFSTAGSGSGGGSTEPFPYVPPPVSGPCGPDAVYMNIASTASQSVQTITATAGQYIYVLRIHIDCEWLGVSEWSLWLTTDTGIGSPSSIDPDDYEVLKIIPALALPGTHSFGTWNSPFLTGDSTMHVFFAYPVQEGYGVFRGATPVWEHSVITVANSGTYYFRSGNIVGDGYFGATGYTADICVVVSDLAPEDFIPPSLTGSSDAIPPASGKPWGPIAPVETPDGATTVFTLPTGYTWATGSLKVFVDDLDQTAAVTSQDGDASPATFTLSFAPWGTDTVTVSGIQV